jgi:hypothetical protein
MDSLKDISGLDSRFLQSNIKDLDDEIDYCTISGRLNKMAETSIVWLINALSKNKRNEKKDPVC